MASSNIPYLIALDGGMCNLSILESERLINDSEITQIEKQIAWERIWASGSLATAVKQWTETRKLSALAHSVMAFPILILQLQHLLEVSQFLHTPV